MCWQIINCLVLLALFSCAVSADSQSMAQSDEVMQKLIQDGLLHFTVDLTKNLHQTATTGENILFSPLNIYSALSLAHLAAANETRSEFAKFLGWPQDESQVPSLHKNFGEMQKLLNSDGTKAYDRFTIVKLANGIFVDKNYSIKASYEQEVNKYYANGKVESVDYSDGTTATDTINKWASNATEGRIPQLFSEPISTDTVTLLASSLYFCGKWDEPFHNASTKSEKFQTGSSMVDAQMMNLVDFVPYTNNKALQFEAILKQYAGGNYSMVFILPNEKQTLMNLTSLLTTAELENIVKNSTITGVDYKIPRTKFSMSKSLKEVLAKQGLNNVFSSTNLGNLVDAPSKLSDVYHAAEIELDERGTKASAITALQFVYLSAPSIPRKPIKFYVNKPFMLALYHHTSSTFLFVGLVNKPVV